jgi:hypothetical protein
MQVQLGQDHWTFLSKSDVLKECKFLLPPTEMRIVQPHMFYLTNNPIILNVSDINTEPE